MIENAVTPAMIAAYDAYTHEHMDRRRLLADIARLGGTAALVGLIAADASAAPRVAPDDKRLRARPIRLGAGDGAVAGYSARPAESARAGPPTIVVIHENRGLNDHMRDVARRYALAGFHAVAVDFLSSLGGTPSDENLARERIGALPEGQAIETGLTALTALAKDTGGPIGAVGFCWGGGMVHKLAAAVGDMLTAGVAYYGPAPDPIRAAAVRARLMWHLAGDDARVNSTRAGWEAALAKAGRPIVVHDYPGTSHGFNNDTAAARYNAAAAALAFDRSVAFLRAALV